MDESVLVSMLENLKDEGRSAFTLDTYRQNLRTFLRWCTAEQLTPETATAERLKIYLRRFPNDRTRRLHLAGLRQFYGFMRTQGRIVDNPTRATNGDGRLVLPLPRIKRRAPRVITDEEEAALFKSARGDLETWVLLRLMRFSGLRISEVVGHRRRVFDPYTRRMIAYEAPGLRLCDIDLARGILDVRGKGQQEDLAYLDRHTGALIDRLIHTLPNQRPNDPLFQRPGNGGPKGTKWAFRQFSQLCTIAGISRHLTLHMWRHTFLTRFLEHGGNLRAAQRLARHR